MCKLVWQKSQKKPRKFSDSSTELKIQGFAEYSMRRKDAK